MWALGGASRGPDDATWKQQGPHVAIGAYDKADLPPGIVGQIDGVPIVIFDNKPPRLRGKTIDFRNERFELVE